MSILEIINNEIRDLEHVSEQRKKRVVSDFILTSLDIPLIFRYDFKIIYMKKIKDWLEDGHDLEYAVKILTRRLLKRTKDSHDYRAIESIKNSVEADALKEIINHYSLMIKVVSSPF